MKEKWESVFALHNIVLGEYNIMHICVYCGDIRGGGGGSGRGKGLVVDG